MAVVQTLIGNVKGPQGERGAQGVQGEQGDAATISVGSVTTVPYGTNASVVNSGTEQEAILDFRIPQGRPGEQVTQLDNLVLNSITEPSTQFPIPAIGDIGSALFGKISKWFSDMSALVATKLNVANVVNNLITTASGYALDARQGKALYDDISHLGVFYTTGWTATSSSASNVRLTGVLDMLPKGIYLITGAVPISSNPNNLLALTGTNVNIRAQTYYPTASYTRVCEIVEVTDTPMNLYLMTAGTAQTTYSNTERGYLRATRLDAIK